MAQSQPIVWSRNRTIRFDCGFSYLIRWNSRTHLAILECVGFHITASAIRPYVPTTIRAYERMHSLDVDLMVVILPNYIEASHRGRGATILRTIRCQISMNARATRASMRQRARTILLHSSVSVPSVSWVNIARPVSALTNIAYNRKARTHIQLLTHPLLTNTITHSFSVPLIHALVQFLNHSLIISLVHRLIQ